MRPVPPRPGAKPAAVQGGMPGMDSAGGRCIPAGKPPMLTLPTRPPRQTSCLPGTHHDHALFFWDGDRKQRRFYTGGGGGAVDRCDIAGGAGPVGVAASAGAGSPAGPGVAPGAGCHHRRFFRISSRRSAGSGTLSPAMSPYGGGRQRRRQPRPEGGGPHTVLSDRYRNPW